MASTRQITLLTAVLLMAGAAPGSAANLAAGEYETKRLLSLMDTDKNGMVSKSEFLDYMSAEFDRLDTNHNGELDGSELAKMRVGHNHGFGK